MAEIPIGAKLERTVLVTSEIAISFLGLEGARVLGTPYMIGLMEHTCRDLALPHLDPGHDTVGTHVNVAHVGAAPMGSSVTFRAELLSREDRRLNFGVTCTMENGDRIGEGTHQRTIINVARFTEKMKAKLAAEGFK